MKPDHESLVRRVAERLRHRPLLQFIGRVVDVASAQSALADVHRNLELGGDWRPDSEFHNIDIMIAQCGLLDLRFESLAPRLTDADAGGLALLEQLGLWRQSYATGDPWTRDWFLSILDTLDEEIAGARTWLRLFLTVDPSGSRRKIDPVRGFPLRFHVLDVCLTNAPWLWASKYCWGIEFTDVRAT